MKRIITIWSLLFVMITHIAAIGQWKAYMAYHNITDIEPAGKLVYVLSSNDLFSYNVNDKSINIYNKVNSLSDSFIDFIAWNNTAKKLVIIYNNQNIDLLDQNDNIENICDFHNKSLLTSKTIYNITNDNNYAYISSASGILKINVAKAEISDTYYFGQVISDVILENNNIYALTTNGNVYVGNQNNNLTDPDNWTITDSHPAFTDDNDITISNDNGYKEYIAYDKTNKCYWSNQSDDKLQQYTLSEEGVKTILASNIIPEGPKYNYFGYMKMYKGKLYTCGGGFSKMGDLHREGCIQVLDENEEWTIYQDNIAELTGHDYLNISCLDIDPTSNTTRLFASGRTGIYEFNEGQFVNHFTYENSPIQTAYTLIDNKDYEWVFGMLFDNDGNLWCLNSNAPTQSLLRYDGTWQSYHNSALMQDINRSMVYMRYMMFDSRGYMCFVNDYWTNAALILYNINTNEFTVYNEFVNQNGNVLNVEAINDLKEDLDHNLWIMTNLGPLMLPEENIINDDKTFTQVIVPRNDGTNLGDYLLSGILTTAMAIDGGGRKWIGTQNGLYLISADNFTQEAYFTEENSNILSNNIESLAINQETGEVFIGTDKGLCSYMSDAVAANEEMTKDNVWAYPNPVKPDYTGLITITGLSYQSDVKIVTVNGFLVAEGKSNGGIFTWDGCDLSGKKVASGVYMVQTAKSDGSKGTVCKIAIVR